MGTIRVGSRESVLAVAQAEIVMEAIRRQNASIRLELVTMKTTGDRELEKPLQEIGGKAVFVKELEQALLEKQVDICVHSLKDMAVELNPLLPIVAVGKREDPQDVLVLPQGAKKLEPGEVIGCSSARRSLQLAGLYPNNPVEPVRGNVLTRLNKLDSGQYGALVLAAAGLRRLGLENRISRTFTVDEMLPACGQGILAVQGRAGETAEYLQGFYDKDAWDAAAAERAFIQAISGGCTSPVTAHAQISGEELVLTGYGVDRQGNRVPGTLRGPRQNARQLGKELGERLKAEAEQG